MDFRAHISGEVSEDFRQKLPLKSQGVMRNALERMVSSDTQPEDKANSQLK